VNTSAQQSKKGELPKCCPRVSIVPVRFELRKTGGFVGLKRPQNWAKCWPKLK
jgi:hypothetical protein